MNDFKFAIRQLLKNSGFTAVAVITLALVSVANAQSDKVPPSAQWVDNDVLPHTAVDYVSYSCYETINSHIGNVSKPLHDALNFIESKLPPKVDIHGKRVFIGEYGFSLEHTKTPQKQDLYARDVCRAALEWGCPFVLYWEM